MQMKRNRTELGRGDTLYLHVVTVHETMHNLLEEKACLRLSKPLPLPHIIQQRTPLCQLHHLKKKKTDISVKWQTNGGTNRENQGPLQALKAILNVNHKIGFQLMMN